MNSTQVRQELVEALRLDLVGPSNDEQSDLIDP